MGFSPNGNFSIQTTLQAVLRESNILVYSFPPPCTESHRLHERIYSLILPLAGIEIQEGVC